MKEIYKKKFKAHEISEAIAFFVQNGYVIFEGVYDDTTRLEIHDWLSSRYEALANLAANGEIPFDINGWAVAIIKKFELTPLYGKLSYSPELIKILSSFLGPDLCVLGQEALWINVPSDTDPVLNKGVHTDAWTGTSDNTLFAKYFVTDCDEFNGMTVVPGSHNFGFVPCRNREVDPLYNIDSHIEEVNLDNAKSGDLLIWHALTLHATRGHSDRNTRISITSRYTSTETPFSSQERALGYRPLTVGPLNQIRRVIGTDSLAPFRTLGGHVGVDRRLQHLYGHGVFKPSFDFDRFISY